MNLRKHCTYKVSLAVGVAGIAVGALSLLVLQGWLAAVGVSVAGLLFGLAALAANLRNAGPD
jgi:hypothetical protein